VFVFFQAKDQKEAIKKDTTKMSTQLKQHNGKEKKKQTNKQTNKQTKRGNKKEGRKCKTGTRFDGAHEWLVINFKTGAFVGIVGNCASIRFLLTTSTTTTTTTTTTTHWNITTKHIFKRKITKMQIEPN
jgi:hypothetical protein